MRCSPHARRASFFPCSGAVSVLARVLIAASLASAGLAQGVPRWSYFDSRETPHPPRLSIQAEDGQALELAAVADTVLLAYLGDRPFGAHAQLSVDLADLNRVLVRWDVPPGLRIARASALVSAHPSSNLPPTEAFDVALHRVSGPWSESETAWNSQPAFDAAIAARASLRPEGGELELDVTELARAWSSGTTENHGVLLRVVEPTASAPASAADAAPPPSASSPHSSIGRRRSRKRSSARAARTSAFSCCSSPASAARA